MDFAQVLTTYRAEVSKQAAEKLQRQLTDDERSVLESVNSLMMLESIERQLSVCVTIESVQNLLKQVESLSADKARP